MMSESNKKKYILSFLWPIITLFVVFVYLNGVTGPFLFDDFANLNSLGAHGGIKDWSSFWLYVSQGTSGPTGRPISLISFLIDANDWPADPSRFKYTNVLIHALNGCLLFWVQFKLLESVTHLSKGQRVFVAAFSSFLWLAHPFFVSTVLYVVQRMAMLAATFVLAGLLSHIYLRNLWLVKPRLAPWVMTASLGFWGGLAVLSKENGALLPVFILIIESTVYGKSKIIGSGWKKLCLWAPAILIFLYLIYMAGKQGFFQNWPGRAFSPYERLITEARILCEYLFHLIFFRVGESGLFHDGYDISKSLLSPLYTLPSVGLVASLVAAGLWLRKKNHILALAVLFYFSGHLIESTSIGLELYFEHRNYLPAIFLFLPISLLLIEVKGWLKGVTIAVVCFLVVLLLFYRVDLWRSNVSLALAWSEHAPASVRAQRSAAIALVESGNHEKALAVLNRAYQKHPGSHSILMHRMILKCSLGVDITKDKINLLRIAREEPFNPKLTNLLSLFVDISTSGKCTQLNSGYTELLLSGLLSNATAKESEGFLHQLFYFKGVVYSHGAQSSEAERYFVKAIRLRPGWGLLMRSISVLAGDGNCKSALELAELAGKEDAEIKLDEGKINNSYYNKEHGILVENIKSSCVTK